MGLTTVIICDNRELQIHESEWKHSMHRWKVDKQKTMHIGCRTFNASSRKDFSPSTQVAIRKFPEQKPEPTIDRLFRKHWQRKRSTIIWIWIRHIAGKDFNDGYACINNDVSPTKFWEWIHSDTHKSKSLHFWHPYVIKNTGQQQILFNATYSLKRVQLSMQIHVSAIKPICSPFLGTSCAGWCAWLHERTLTSSQRLKRDVTGILGTSLGVLNSPDAEVLTNKLVTTAGDFNRFEHPLRSSLLTLGNHQ